MKEGQHARLALHEIEGFLVVLHHVRNVYPVAKSKAGWEWGFKFSDGFYENFTFSGQTAARQSREAFVKALRDYWRKQEIND